MKTVFIINPHAGQGKKLNSLIDKINNFKDYDIEMYITKFAGDATSYVKSYCEDNGPARFIACGGDGTLNEVLNGIMGFDDAEVGIIPVGTGNDFRRNFENSDMFDDAQCHNNTRRKSYENFNGNFISCKNYWRRKGYRILCKGRI